MNCLPPLLLCVVLFSANEADRRDLLAESFDGALPANWRWVRESPSEWRIRDGKLAVRSQPGKVWGGNDAKNILLVKPSQFDKVAASIGVVHRPKELWEQAGLLWYVDDDNFVKLVSEHIQGKMYVVIASEERGRGEVFGKIDVPTSDLQLRLRIEGDRVTGQWRLKTEDAWQDVGTCSFPVEGNRHFGIFTQNGPQDPVRWVSFDDFVVTASTLAP